MSIEEQVAEKDRLRINLSNAHIPGAGLRFAQLKYSDFRGANLAEADFEGAVLCGANFSDARLTNANFQYADLRGANFSKSDLDHASLDGANLSNADFSVAKMHSTDIRDTDLTKAKGLTWNTLLECNFNLNTKLPEELQKDDLVGYLDVHCPKLRWQQEDDDDLSALINFLVKLKEQYDQPTIWAAIYRHNKIQEELEISNE